MLALDSSELLLRWPPWELEELRSVQAYPTTRIRGIIQQMRIYQRGVRPYQQRLPITAFKYQVAPDKRFFSREFKVSRHAVTIEYISSLGLGVFRTLFAGNIEEQTAIVLKNACGSASFLSDALELALIDPARD